MIGNVGGAAFEPEPSTIHPTGIPETLFRGPALAQHGDLLQTLHLQVSDDVARMRIELTALTLAAERCSHKPPDPGPDPQTEDADRSTQHRSAAAPENRREA